MGYLLRYRRFMDYAGLNYPLGSGIVESACKQVVSERMKLSGMRWHHTGGQRTMTLRCLLLSGIWDKAYRQYTASKPTVTDLMHSKTRDFHINRRTERIAPAMDRMLLCRPIVDY